MRTINYLLSLLVVLCVVQAGVVHAAEPDRKADDKAAKEKNKKSLTLLDPGEAPHRELRYDFQIGTEETMVMDMHIVISAGGQVVDTPPMRMTATIKAEELTEEGNLRQSFKFQEVTVQDRPNDPPQMVQAMRRELAGMKGMTGSSVISPRGRTIESELDIPENATPQLRQQLEQTKRSMAQRAVVLPERAVGKGARWEVRQPVHNQGFKMLQIVTYTVREIDETGVILDLTIEQQAPDQALPNGVKLSAFNSQGKGKIQLAFQKQVPIAEMELNTKFDQQVNGHKISSGMDMSLSIAPPKADDPPAKPEALN